MMLRERLLLTAQEPNAAFLILVVGMLLIYAEFCRPGLVIPGALGGVLVTLALHGLAASPLRGGGIALLLLAAAAFAMSAFVQTRGGLGLLGGVAMAAGAMLLVDAPAPQRIRMATAVGLAVPFAIATTLLTEAALRARANKSAEQIRPVVFSASADISSTISAVKGRANQTGGARRT